MEKKRDTTFDIAKGIAILLVVIGHFIPANAPGWYEGFIRFFYHFHMPVFFVIAGYFYARSTKQLTYKELIKAKFERLMVPYFLLFFIIVGFKFFAQLFVSVDHPITLTAFYRMFYSTDGAFFLWFVYVLFLIFAIVPLFKKTNGLIALSLVSLVLPFIPHVIEVCCLRQLCDYLVFFVAGMWVVRGNLLDQYVYRGTPLWILLTIVLVWLPLNSFEITAAINIVWGIVGSFMLLGISNHLSQYKYTQLFNALGLYSMVIYLFHTMFMGGGKVILAHLFLPVGIINFILSSLFIIGVGIISPICLYKWILAKNKFTARIFK